MRVISLLPARFCSTPDTAAASLSIYYLLALAATSFNFASEVKHARGLCYYLGIGAVFLIPACARTPLPMTRVHVRAFGGSLSVDWGWSHHHPIDIYIHKENNGSKHERVQEDLLSSMPTISKLWKRIKTWPFTVICFSTSDSLPCPPFSSFTHYFCLFFPLSWMIFLGLCMGMSNTRWHPNVF